MDINDPRYRLQVLNQSNPSIRVQVAPKQPAPQISQPSQSQNISIAQPKPLPNISVPSAVPSTPSNQVNTSWSTPDTPKQGWFGKAVSSVINPVSKFANELGGLGALLQPNRASIATRQQESNNILNPGGGLGHQGGVLGNAEAGPGAVFIGPNAKQNIEKTVGEGGQLAALGIGGGSGGVVKGIAGGAAAGAVGSAGSQLGDTGKIDLSQLGIDTATGGILGGAGHAVGRVFSKITGKTGATKLVNDIAGSNDVGAIQSRLPGIDAPTANFLAGETNPEVVHAVLNQAADNAGVTFKDWVKSPDSTASNAKDATDLAPGEFDASNPPQSALPAGMHAPNAPDPVKVLSDEAAKATSAEDFASAVSRLTGEDRAVAESALNGMKPEDFYAAVKGDTSVPAYRRAIPQTVHEAAAQHDLGVHNYNPDVLSADKRLESQAPDTTSSQLDIPSFIRKNPDQAISDARTMMDNIDSTLSKLGTGQASKFAAKVDYAKNAKANPDAAKALYEHKMAAYDPKNTEEITKTLLAEKQRYQEIINHANNAKRGESIVGESKAEIPPATTVPAPKTPASGVADAAPTGDLAPTKAAPADTNAPAANTSDVTSSADPAVENVLQKLDDASQLHSPEAKAFSKQRGSALYRGEAAAQAADGVDAHFAALKSMKGVTKQSGFQPIEVDKPTQDALINKIYNNPDLLPGEKLNAGTALLKVFGVGEGGTPTPSDVNYLRKALGNEVADAVEQNVNLAGKTTRERLAMVASTPKAAMATADLSAPLRQGGVLGARFPQEWAKNSAQSAKYFVNKDFFNQQMDAIKARPNWETYGKMGLHVEAANESTGTEEALQTSLLQTKTAQKLLVGKPAMGADRAYSGFLTKFRADVADNIIGHLKDAGVFDQMSDKDLRSLGKFINTASGRGDLGNLERHAGLLSKALFSPRLWKSRLDLLNPVYYAKLSGPARKYALQTSASFAGVAATVLGLASAAGAKVIWDPRSADFAKIKVGNTRYDILGGLQQNIRLGAQMYTGQKINSSTGEIQTLGDGITTPTRKDLLYEFFQNKENPLVGYATKVLGEKKDSAGQTTDQYGNPVNNASEAAKLFIPLNFQDTYQTGQDVGNYVKGAGMALPGFIGAGVQTYGNTATKNQGPKDAQGNPTWKGPIAPNMVTDPNTGQPILDAKGKPVTVKLDPKATELQTQAQIDAARHNALKGRYEATLPKEDQALMKLSDQQLNDYVTNGQITQDKMDHIKNIQKTAESQSVNNQYKVPDGVKSPSATQIYQKFNSMDAKDQKYWLSDKNPPEQAAIDITNQLNQQKAAGLSDFKPSNQLAKMYADYEKDINTNPQYSEVDKRNKAKAFQTAAAKLQVGETAKSIFNEGSSNDLRTLMANKKINKADLDAAINLDNELYNSGLTGSLKFSKKFRNEMGYGVPTNGPASSSGGGSGGGSGSSGTKEKARDLSSLIPSGNPSTGNKAATTNGLPQFSARTRSAYLPGFTSISLPQIDAQSTTRGQRLVSPTPQKAKFTP